MCLGKRRLDNVHGNCASMRCIFSGMSLTSKGGVLGTMISAGKGRCASRVR